jgi:hypothetical protein
MCIWSTCDAWNLKFIVERRHWSGGWVFMDSRNENSWLAGVMRRQIQGLTCFHLSNSRSVLSTMAVWEVVLGLVMVAGTLGLLFWHLFLTLSPAYSDNHDFSSATSSLVSFFQPTLPKFVPRVRGTSIQGLSAVQRFRSHVACFR